MSASNLIVVHRRTAYASDHRDTFYANLLTDSRSLENESGYLLILSGRHILIHHYRIYYSTPLSLASLNALPLGPASRKTSFTPILSLLISIASVNVSVLPQDDLDIALGLDLFL
jgi:hypothetical protein